MIIQAIFTKGYIIPSLLISIIFALTFRSALKKYPVVFYILFAIITTLISLLFINREIFGIKMKEITAIPMYFINMYRRGALGFALFIIVMFIGVLDIKKPLVRKLMALRGELSIIACIASLCHLVIYAQGFISRLILGKEIDGIYLFLFITSVSLFLIMVPLFITSFMSIRTKMDPIKWKKLQNKAYIFYFILFINVIAVFIRRVIKKDFDITTLNGASSAISLSIYIILLVLYGVLLIRKFKSSKV